MLTTLYKKYYKYVKIFLFIIFLNVFSLYSNLCQYFRTWTERSWRAESGDTTWRLQPALLAAVTAALYAACGVLTCVHALALWALHPQYGDADRECRDTRDTRVTDYLDTSDLQIDHAKQNYNMKFYLYIFYIFNILKTTFKVFPFFT